MASTEASILEDFLLPPSALSSILSFEGFSDLFPQSQRSNRQIKHLYEELNNLRTRYIEHVKNVITREVQIGEYQRRQVVNARLRGIPDVIDGLNVERSTGEHTDSGLSSEASPSEYHTLSSIIPEMEQASQHIESEIATSEREVIALMEEIESTIDALGDLRHGGFTKATGPELRLQEEVLAQLKELDDVCNATGDNRNY